MKCAPAHLASLNVAELVNVAGDTDGMPRCVLQRDGNGNYHAEPPNPLETHGETDIVGMNLC